MTPKKQTFRFLALVLITTLCFYHQQTPKDTVNTHEQSISVHLCPSVSIGVRYIKNIILVAADSKFPINIPTSTNKDAGKLKIIKLKTQPT
ncbi:hypothetical protein NIES592_20440 [Fischerella major NIES-592]|uniref:Uncharacterized protein n=1 Tax=Fischerella major NIES-592 TaxID=210994 RepID=A0A1U7GUT0_9CYAN|nr:hypothetical protein NIES592_20440 [Fischerella major NIES-592]